MASLPNALPRTRVPYQLGHPGPPSGDTDEAFRFGVDRCAKLKARDDLMRVTANLRATVANPISLPTWRHLPQMAGNVYKSGFTGDCLRVIAHLRIYNSPQARGMQT